MAKKEPAAQRAPASKIVAVYNQKGGCCKTMTAMQLGGALAQRGYKSLVVDLDSQHTCVTWAAQAASEEPFPATVISLAGMGAKFLDQLRKLAPDYDVILLDCPPAIESPIPWAALQIADLGLIPIIPVFDNYWASKEAKELGLRAKIQNTSLQLFWLPSRMQRGKIYAECLKIIKNDDIPAFENYFSQRNSYVECQPYGITVHGLSNSAAKQEVEAVTDELLGHLDLEETAQ